VARHTIAAKAPAALTALLLGATAARAQPVVIADSGDSGWMLAASLLALGGAISGLIGAGARKSPVVVVGCIAATVLIFVGIGYSLMFGDGSAWLGGLGNAFLANLTDLRVNTTIPESIYVLFELALAIFAVALLAAALPAAARPAWVYPFAALWFLVVYVPVARWIWSGWLADLGAVDYAGGIVVQITAATGTLVIALLLRQSNVLRQSTPDILADDAVAPMGAAGVAVAWLAVLGGSAIGAGDDAAVALLNGLVAAGSGVVVSLIARRQTPSSDGNRVVIGGLTGLAAASTGAALIGIPGAMILGVVGALAARLAGTAIGRLSRDAIAPAVIAQGIGAFAGALLFPVFVLPQFGGPGFDEATGLITLLTGQAIATIVVTLWTLVATTIAALAVSTFAPMRRDPTR
jgi:ammonium transporter, Amt family